jgi:hypothetical protein
MERLVVLLLLHAVEELRDRGLVHAELGRPAEAAVDLATTFGAARMPTTPPALRDGWPNCADGAPRLH